MEYEAVNFMPCLYWLDSIEDLGCSVISQVHACAVRIDTVELISQGVELRNLRGSMRMRREAFKSVVRSHRRVHC